MLVISYSGMARSRMIMIRVDDAEHALFKGAAAAVSVSISEYARDAMLARMALEQAPVAPVVIRTPAEARVVVEALAPKAEPVDEHVVDKSVPGWEMAELRRRAGWVRELCRCDPGTAGRCAHCRETGMRRAGLGRFGSGTP